MPQKHGERSVLYYGKVNMWQFGRENTLITTRAWLLLPCSDLTSIIILPSKPCDLRT